MINNIKLLLYLITITIWLIVFYKIYDLQHCNFVSHNLQQKYAFFNQ